MALIDEATRLTGIVDRLRGPLGNSGNTRALLIEPMLSALGWDTTDLGQVVRDWPLTDSVPIAYSLRIADETAMLIQARGVMEAVDDPIFVKQTLTVAAADGAPWCVLTNGVSYRVFKTSEPPEGDHGLLFELTLEQVAGGASPEAAANLELLHRAAVARGDLDRRSSERFLDPRVRQALADLCRDPSPAFIAALNDSLGRPAVRVEDLRASLVRVLEVNAAAREANAVAREVAPLPPASEPETSAAVAGEHANDAATEPPPAPWQRADPAPVVPQEPEHGARWASLDIERDLRPNGPGVQSEPGGDQAPASPEATTWREPPDGTPRAARGAYPLADYLAGKPAEMVRVFEQLDGYAAGLGEDTARHVRKQYVEYFRGTRFWFTLEVLGERVHLNLALDPAKVEAHWAEDRTLPPIDVRSPGIGQTEFAISDASQLAASRQLIRLAYDRFSAPELA
jgi:predicted transport protein